VPLWMILLLAALALLAVLLALAIRGYPEDGSF
jgi:hypothetical protein